MLPHSLIAKPAFSHTIYFAQHRPNEASAPLSFSQNTVLKISIVRKGHGDKEKSSRCAKASGPPASLVGLSARRYTPELCRSWCASLCHRHPDHGRQTDIGTILKLHGEGRPKNDIIPAGLYTTTLAFLTVSKQMYLPAMSKLLLLRLLNRQG